MEARTLKIPNHLQQVYVTLFFFKKGVRFQPNCFRKVFFFFLRVKPDNIPTS